MDSMNKEYIIAKIRRQQAEIGEIICAIKADKRMSNMVDILKKRYRETSVLLEALGDKSFIPRGVEAIDVSSDLMRIGKKTKKVKDALKRLARLEKEREKIEAELAREK